MYLMVKTTFFFFHDNLIEINCSRQKEHHHLVNVVIKRTHCVEDAEDHHIIFRNPNVHSVVIQVKK